MNESDHTPRVVSRAEWQAAHDRLLAKEKAATHARDALAAERRRLPWLKMEKNYVFDGPRQLRDLFDGRRQLILYSFMFATDVDGWPEAGCPGCSFFVDNLGNTAHLHARDSSRKSRHAYGSTIRPKRPPIPTSASSRIRALPTSSAMAKWAMSITASQRVR